MSNLPFRPVRGSDKAIQAISDYNDGWVYFATDTGRIYVDTRDERIAMGSAGASIYFGEATDLVADEDTQLYTIYKTDVDGSPKKEDLILNSDGGFYKIETVKANYYLCSLLSISGTGGGGGGGTYVPTTTQPTLTISMDNQNLINGQSAYINVVAASDLERDGETPVDTTLTVTLTLSIGASNYYTTTRTYKTAEKGYYDKYGVGEGKINDKIEIGGYLKESSTTTITVQVKGTNHDEASKAKSIDVTTTELKLEQPSGYSATTVYSADKTVDIVCNVVGTIDKKLTCYFDDELFDSKVLGPSTSGKQTFTIPKGAYDADGNPKAKTATHGYHTVRLELVQMIGEDEGEAVTPLEYEIAVVKNDSSYAPVIWLGSYQSEYYAYDAIRIPFLVYDPASTNSVSVHLYKDGVELDSSPRELSNLTDFYYWEIADAEMDKINTYSISCGEDDNRKSTREIRFTVVADPNRDMTIESGSLQLNFTATGRSNTEPLAKRKKWENPLKEENPESATFTDFNWYNNGWVTDSDQQSCLRVSNGAKFTIPYEKMVFNSSISGQQSHSLEMQFKVKNIQKYGSLITDITRYKNDTAYYEAFQAQKETGYDNYDSYLQATLSGDAYDDLEFERVQKVIEIDNAVGGLYNVNEDTGSVTGFVIGVQDAFFSNGTNIVNVSFVEDELVNLSFVYQQSLQLLYIYINGCITGVVKSSLGSNATFAIDSDFVLTSDHCDIDLYKLRIYSVDLDVGQITKNFAVDRRDITTYDQNGLASENQVLKEFQVSYSAMLEYNKNHEDEPLMPYIIFDTGTADSKLPYSKSNKVKAAMEFVNVPLDSAYALGKLEELAREDGLISANETDGDKIAEAIKTYYKYHCPSFTTEIQNNDVIELSVQGTSSQFYPRRNYKAKTKVSGEFNWKNNEELDPEDQTDNGGAYTASKSLNLFMHKGPYEEDYLNDQAKVVEDPKYLGYEVTRLADGWYLDNYTNATDRWTLKVDFMESSGSYNAGFANMVGKAYTKHPLEDYLDVLTNTNLLYPKVSNLKMRWQDYRTSVQGFPVMAFWKHGDEYTFIGYYRMLLDKGSDEVYGFDVDKNIKNTLLDNTSQKKITECWEFSNNARGFCSYRDPWNRVDLSFKAPVGAANEYTTGGAPVVANSFEYRYSNYDDSLDVLYEFNQASQADLDDVADDLGLEVGSIQASERSSGAEALFSVYKNWEKAVKWVWSTNLDAVISQSTYTVVPVGDTLYQANTFYVINDSGNYELCADEEFDSTKTYYKLVGEEYSIKNVTSKDYLFETNKFYYAVSDDVYALATEFDAGIEYYVAKDLDNLEQYFDLLVAPAAGEYNASETYYTRNSEATINPGAPTGAVVKVDTPSEDDFNAGLYYVASPVTYGKKTFAYDSKEYRSAKFTNEFESHFDPEYVATFFAMTEVMECYDSRGKNCMMASWGPHEAGGDYIWYPIFYDIDTQLGINNTGIPSFTYNVDATEAGNFSTSDSILWNNFYKFFKDTWMKPKYANLRGISTSKFDELLDTDGKTSTAPLQSAEYIEKWYNFDYSVTKNLACTGQKPLIATNLDMYFKYITITNDKAKDQGVAHLGDDGEYASPDSGTYFYALQGDRSQSRRQFVNNRLEFADSWLNQGNYARGGNNRLWGRISANNTTASDVHSDKWVEDNTHPYWVDGVEFGEKTHEFDAEYWIEPTPVRSCYITAGDDSANYPSEKYDGVHKVKFVLGELENGIRTSNNYPEQLLYLYGMNQMSDFGDLSKMYWTEFKMEGNADKLTRLKLGHDGTTYDYVSDSATEKKDIPWYNKKINGLTIPKSLPLLKEANFCNMGFSSDTSIDLSSSEKLENFRATGTSNISTINFAEGVALNTLYYPATVSSLTLIEANLLTKLLKEYTTPKTDENGNLVAEEGLYLENFFEADKESKLSTIVLKGGGLGYQSYDILEELAKKTTAKITMTDVNWCPYTALTEGDVYDSAKKYYKDNGHYGFAEYEFTSLEQFNADILTGILYREDNYGGRTDGGEFSEAVTHLDDKAYDILVKLAKGNFQNGYGQGIPNITGLMYIHNDTAVSEEDIEVLQESYPDLTIFFKTVDKAYSARFVLYDEDTLSESYVKWADGSTRPSVLKVQNYSEGTFFDSPFELFKPEKVHHDFKGWSLSKNPASEEEIMTPGDGKWESLELTEGEYDYTFYAIFVIHSYDLVFYANGEYFDTITLPYGQNGKSPVAVPYKDSSNLGLYEAYDFKGWSRSETSTKITAPEDYVISSNMTFYAVFGKIDDIRTVVHSDWFAFTLNNDLGGYVVRVAPDLMLAGKVTLPRTYAGKPVTYIQENGFQGQTNLTHIFIEEKKSSDTAYNTIGSSAFSNCSALVYFDFADSNVTKINSTAFRGCALNPNITHLEDAPLEYIGPTAFNQAFYFLGHTDTNSKPAGTIYLPSSIQAIGGGAFTFQGSSNRHIKVSFILGSQSSPFDENSIGAEGGGTVSVFGQNSGYAGTFTLYSSNAASLETVINGRALSEYIGSNFEEVTIL